MNFKKYHVSKNLADLYGVNKTALNLTFTTTDNMKIVVNGRKGIGVNVIPIKTPNIVVPAGTYTVKIKMVDGYIENMPATGYGVFFGINQSTYSQRTTPRVLSVGDVGTRTFTLSEDTTISSFDITPGYAMDENGPIFNNATFECWFYAGSEALPYEPYSSEVWHDIPYYQHKTATDTLTLPAVIYPNDTSITVGLKGNTVQSGTPTPDNPVMPQGTGERTGNLLPEFYAASGEISGNSYTITKNSIETHNDGSVLGAWYVLSEFKRYGNYANYTPIDEKHSIKIPAGTYTFSGNENIHSKDNGLRLIIGQLGQAVAGASAGAINIGVGQTFTVNADSYVCPVLEIRYDSHVDEYILTNPMLNLGSTPLPYEPYGYFIEIEVS